MDPHDPTPDERMDAPESLGPESLAPESPAPEPLVPEAEEAPAGPTLGGLKALRVDAARRPGWIRGTDRTPVVGEPAYCVGGEGAVAALHGRTGDGSRLVEIRFGDATKPFFAAASNILLLAD